MDIAQGTVAVAMAARTPKVPDSRIRPNRPVELLATYLRVSTSSSTVNGAASSRSSGPGRRKDDDHRQIGEALRGMQDRQRDLALVSPMGSCRGRASLMKYSRGSALPCLPRTGGEELAQA